MVRDTIYYDIIGASPSSSEIELKKAYRKRAIQLHPDKNGNDPAAAAKFQELGEAYAVLSNPEQRKIYDEVGVDGLKEAGGDHATGIDPSEFFKLIFGGDAFHEWLGKLSMFEEMNQTADILAEEDDDVMSPSDMVNTGIHNDVNNSVGAQSETLNSTSTDLTARNETQHISTPFTDAQNEVQKKKSKKRITREQREKLYEAHEEGRRIKEERVATLTKSLLSRIESFESCMTKESKSKYRANLLKELEDLKIESFGIQLLHLIGKIYVSKANATISATKTFGVSKIFTSVKSKSERVKGGFSILKSALDAQTSAEEMIKRQAALEQSGAELTEKERFEQMEAERNITGKLLATAWASTQFEVNGILNKVTAKVLNDKALHKKQRVSRAEALLFIGKEMLATERTPEEEEEARIFEEMMADASAKKSKGKKKKMTEDEYMKYFASVEPEFSKD